jgi:MFS family permease
MFRQLIDTAKLSVSNTVSKFAGRAGVGVAMLIAAIFLLLAITAWLIDRFGASLGYLIMACGFALIAVAAWLAESARERRRARDLHAAQVGSSAMVSSLIAAGPLAATSVLRMARRRPTILILAVVLGGLMMRRANRGHDDRTGAG